MDTRLGNLIGALAIGCGDLIRSAMERESALDPAELSGLLAAYTRPGTTIGEIARTGALTHSGAVRVVDRLSERGLVERLPASDRRAVSVRCTAAGRALAERSLAARRDALQGLARTLSETEFGALETALEKMLARLPSNRADAWRICRFCEHATCRGEQCPVGRSVS